MKFMLDDIEIRQAYTDALISLAQKDDRICLVEADLMNANGTKPFLKAFPERTFNVGVAEANMIGVAAGLAASGKIPFANSFTPFATRRCFDQATISVGYTGLPVKIGGTDPGVTAEINGGTHMSVEDVSIMRAMPGMTIFEAVDAEQMKQAMPQIAYSGAPAYIRIFRRKAEKIFGADYQFKLGKADVLRDGADVAIFATGIMVCRALAAAAALADEGVNAAVVNIHTIKPIDAEAVASMAAKCKAVVTAENGTVVGGLGSAVAEVLARVVPTPMRFVGMQDCFGEVGKMDYLLERFKLREQDIMDACREVVKLK